MLSHQIQWIAGIHEYPIYLGGWKLKGLLPEVARPFIDHILEVNASLWYDARHRRGVHILQHHAPVIMLSQVKHYGIWRRTGKAILTILHRDNAPCRGQDHLYADDYRQERLPQRARELSLEERV